MSRIIFPNSPSLNDNFVFNKFKYIWDGKRWRGSLNIDFSEIEQEIQNVESSILQEIENAESSILQEIESEILPEIENLSESFIPLLQIQHKLSGATNSGTFTAGAWRDRPLNYVAVNEIDGANFNTSTLVITLPSGYYEVDAYSCAFYVMNNTAIFRNVDNNQIMMSGDAGLSNNNSGYNNTGSNIKGRLNLTSTTNFKLQHWCSTNRNNDGFGYRNVAAINSVEAIYADLRFWRLADAQ